MMNARTMTRRILNAKHKTLPQIPIQKNIPPTFLQSRNETPGRGTAHINTNTTTGTANNVKYLANSLSFMLRIRFSLSFCRQLACIFTVPVHIVNSPPSAIRRCWWATRRVPRLQRIGDDAGAADDLVGCAHKISGWPRKSTILLTDPFTHAASTNASAVIILNRKFFVA